MIITYQDGWKAEIKDSIGNSILNEVSHAITYDTTHQATLSDILQTISDYLQPEDVFDPERLDDLARSRGFVEGPDFD